MYKTIQKNPWLIQTSPRPQAKIRLFCFPYAGGNTGAFHNWAEHFDDSIEIVALQYPGRATRFKDPLISNMAELVRSLHQGIASEIGAKPYAFFGHSMGASVAFELTQALRNESMPLPKCLFVSGRRAPSMGFPENHTMIHDLPKQAFIQRLKELNGTPEELLAHSDLMDLMEPIIRNDFKLVETWQAHSSEALDLPIVVCSGHADEHLSEKSLTAWQNETLVPCEFKAFPGDHFYLHQQEEALSAFINQKLHLLM